MRTFVLTFLLSMVTAYVSPARAIEPLVSLGAGVLFERGNDNLTEDTRLPLNLAIGARATVWETRLEYSMFRATDGNQTLTVTREHQHWLAWLSYEFIGEKGWAPYAAAALGLARTSVESRLNSTTEAYGGSWAGAFALGVGLRSEWASHFAVRPEFRYESADSFKTKDARMGGVLHIDYLF